MGFGVRMMLMMMINYDRVTPTTRTNPPTISNIELPSFVMGHDKATGMLIGKRSEENKGENGIEIIWRWAYGSKRGST